MYSWADNAIDQMEKEIGSMKIEKHLKETV